MTARSLIDDAKVRRFGIPAKLFRDFVCDNSRIFDAHQQTPEFIDLGQRRGVSVG
jgi:hypothetical protein